MIEMNKSYSDPEDVPTGSTPHIFDNNRRHKRRREDDLCSLKEEFSSFKEEIRNMIKNQEAVSRKDSLVLKEIQQSTHNIENSIAFLSDQAKEFEKKITFLEKKQKDGYDQLAKLENKIEDMQRETLKTNFIIKNVPKSSQETKEDLVKMVSELSTVIGCPIRNEDIKDIHRVREKKDSPRDMPIIVETNSTILRNNVLKACKSHNLKYSEKLRAKHLGLQTSRETPIYVSEHLTSKANRLFFLGRDLINSTSYTYCWSSYGKIYVRKNSQSQKILLHNESQIEQIRKEEVNAK
ncbi:hypothetical protein O0L34_g3684 [Tuta absoluta]|nr:hypothetical protein O0L34_g10418 [Tuta absoluta]KAJ2941463.1 hypothetical protein O0L34_g3684 [Tuta absoluta]